MTMSPAPVDALTDLRAAAATLLGVEVYARRVQTEIQATPTHETGPALTALAHIEAHCRAARADITTIDLTRRGERPSTTIRPAPDRSTQQRRTALAHANTVREYRAHLKSDLMRGVGSLPGLLQNPPQHIRTMKVAELLIHIPKVGRVKANKILTQCRISPSKTIGGLSERQRHELVALLTITPLRGPGGDHE